MKDNYLSISKHFTSSSFEISTSLACVGEEREMGGEEIEERNRKRRRPR